MKSHDDDGSGGGSRVIPAHNQARLRVSTLLVVETITHVVISHHSKERMVRTMANAHER